MTDKERLEKIAQYERELALLKAGADTKGK